MNNELDTLSQNAPELSDDGMADLMRQAEAMDAAHKLATVLTNTDMVPKHFRGKPDDGAAAILYGAEVGLKPQQALQQVFVVHGSPAIYARTMVALLKAKGYRFRTLETSDEQVTVEGVSPRGEVEAATWSIQRATKAGYTSNAKYKSDPQAMLYAKAASEVARKLAPDVLLGIKYSAEDLELDYIDGETVETAPASGGKLSRAISAPPAEAPDAAKAQKPAPAAKKAAAKAPAKGTASAAKKALAEAPDEARVNEIMEAAQGRFTSDVWAELAEVADQRIEELSGGEA